MVGSGLISSSRPSENDSRERPNTSLVKKTTPAALPSISGTLASNETKSWEEFAWGNNQVFERVETTVCSHLTVNSEARFSQPNRTYFSDTNNKQTSQSTRCDTDANTSYSQSNFEIQSTLPAITTSTNSRDDCSVPNSSNRFSPTNPNTNYDSSISRKTSTKSKQISQSTRCDIDANTSYSQSNIGIQSTVPPTTSSSSIRDDCSVPNNFKLLSSENPKTNYDSSISRKTSTKSEQTSQTTRCDIDANTSYSQSNFEIQPTLPPITTSTSIRDDCSVPNNFKLLSSENPKTNYDSSISRKTSTKSEQTSQTTRCDIDANTSYSQSNFEIQPTLPPITTSTSIRDDCSVPNNFKLLSSENPKTNYDSSISRKTSTKSEQTSQTTRCDIDAITSYSQSNFEIQPTLPPITTSTSIRDDCSVPNNFNPLSSENPNSTYDSSISRKTSTKNEQTSQSTRSEIDANTSYSQSNIEIQPTVPPTTSSSSIRDDCSVPNNFKLLSSENPKTNYDSSISRKTSTKSEQTSQTTRCDIDAITSYSQSNFEIQPTLPPITTSTSIRDDCSVPNNFNPLSSENPNSTYDSSISRKTSTKNEQTSQSTRSEIDANTSYSQSNIEIQPTVPSITSSISIRDDSSVPNNLNPFSSANPKTDYNSSISRKTSTLYGVTHEDVFGDSQDKTHQVIANTKIVTPRTTQPSVQQPTERPVSVPWDESLSSHDDVRDWRDLAKLCCCCFFE